MSDARALLQEYKRLLAPEFSHWWQMHVSNNAIANDDCPICAFTTSVLAYLAAPQVEQHPTPVEQADEPIERRARELANRHRYKPGQPNPALEMDFVTALQEGIAIGVARADQDAKRWRHFASSPQTALMLGTEHDPCDASYAWREECDRLADAAIRNGRYPMSHKKREISLTPPTTRRYIVEAPPRRIEKALPKDMAPDWGGKCLNCGSSPTVPKTGLCGPCTFGEAETVGGNW